MSEDVKLRVDINIRTCAVKRYSLGNGAESSVQPSENAMISVSFVRKLAFSGTSHRALQPQISHFFQEIVGSRHKVYQLGMDTLGETRRCASVSTAGDGQRDQSCPTFSKCHQLRQRAEVNISSFAGPLEVTDLL